MTDARQPTPLTGRVSELEDLQQAFTDEAIRALAIVGPSGIGKTALADAFVKRYEARAPQAKILYISLYRKSWTSALAELATILGTVPFNYTTNEIEDAVLEISERDEVLLVLDNVELANASAVGDFTRQWMTRAHDGLLLLTAQPSVDQELPAELPRYYLGGLQEEPEILELFGELADSFDKKALMAVAETVGYNPQAILFLRWLQPNDEASLHMSAHNLQNLELPEPLDDLIERSGLPALFFLALGVHSSSIVREALLASLWDHLGARSAASFVDARELLVDRRYLLRVDSATFRIHESVHVQLEKALIHRVGEARVPSLHHYFSEYYRRSLRSSGSVDDLNLFVYHGLESRNFESVYRTLVDGDGLPEHTSAAHLQQLVSQLLSKTVIASLTKRQRVGVYLKLGELCNDLSEHERTLEFASNARQLLDSAIPDAFAVDRRINYLSAVANSQLGRSEECMKFYFQVVESRLDHDDELACVSLGYLPQDLKYHDINTAIMIGNVAVDWARQLADPLLVAKNLCTQAESLILAGQAAEAMEQFTEAAALAEVVGDQRQLGRVLVNWGFAEAVEGNVTAARAKIAQGRSLSIGVGDRRREAQAQVFEFVAAARAGEWDQSVTDLSRAANMLLLQGDGRWFVPSLFWLLNVLDLDWREYPHANSSVPETRRETLMEIPKFLRHAAAHQEFRVYHRFWLDYLADLIRPLDS
jgi:hypothetical protein